MAQVVIFAPPGEDVSAGKSALEDAGHDVEIVEATPENLLHMAIGMLEGEGGMGGAGGGEKTEEEPAPEEESTEEEPAPEEEPVGEAAVADEVVPVYVGTAGKFSLLRVLDMQDGEKVTYKINESQFSFWKPVTGQRMQNLPVTIGQLDTSLMVKVVAGSKPALVLTAEDAKRLGLR